jgi:hypothetical protein
MRHQRLVGVVPARVGVLERIEAHIRIAMIVQRIARLRNNRIRREEVTQRRVIPAGVVEIQPQRRLLPLPREANARRRRPRRKAGDAEGTIAQLARPGRPAYGVGRPAQVVRQQPVERPVVIDKLGLCLWSWNQRALQLVFKESMG